MDGRAVARWVRRQEGSWETERLSDAAQCLQALSLFFFHSLSVALILSSSPGCSLLGYNSSHGGNSQTACSLTVNYFLPVVVSFLVTYSSLTRKCKDGQSLLFFRCRWRRAVIILRSVEANHTLHHIKTLKCGLASCLKHSQHFLAPN